MIVEERIYTLHPGKVPAFLKFYEEECLAIQALALGNLIGFFQTEIGPLNQVIHMWGYASLDDRAKRRAELYAKPEWLERVPELLKLIVTMENKILIPAAFSPIR